MLAIGKRQHKTQFFWNPGVAGFTGEENSKQLGAKIKTRKLI
jgi:hypothetical protein